MTARYSVGATIIEIELLGYAYSIFDGETDDEYTPNWLNVRVALSSGATLYQATGVMLLTWEVEELAHWCDRVAAADYPPWAQSGVECTPEFDVVLSEGHQPRVKVSLFWPPDVDDDEAEVVFDLDPLLLRTFGQELRNDLSAVTSLPRR